MSVGDLKARTERRKALGAIPKYAHGPDAAQVSDQTRRRTPLGVLAPCAHLGERVGGQPCGSPLRRCSLHLAVTTQFTRCSEAQRCCTACTDFVPKNAHPNIAAAHVFVKAIPPYPDGKYAGRGVVIVGGGKYWPSTYVTVKMLRHVGCDLPVQVWFLGARERDDRYARLLAPLNVEVIDMLAHPEAKNTRCLTGHVDPSEKHGPGSRHPAFEAKSFAALHSPFAEVLQLDADNYPVLDPTVLFDDAGYKRTGAVFWPDTPLSNGWTRWADWGVHPFGQECGLEVGQYLLDKRKVWEPLNLWRFYDDHGDWCYGWGLHHDHGDKGPPRVAFAKFRREWTMFATQTRIDSVSFLQPGPDGRVMFVHRGSSKLVLEQSEFQSTPQRPNVRSGAPLEETAFGYLDELRGLLVGPPPAPPAPVEFPPVEVRHLLFHVYPLPGNGAWQRNVENLLRRWNLFNGRKVVAVATDGGTDDPEAVRAAFGEHAAEIEWVFARNDQNLREVATHAELFGRLETADPTHAVFYGHAKAVSRPAGHVANEWADALYEIYLDYWPLVQKQLRTHPVTGAFKKLGAGWAPAHTSSQWHYGGSFLWARAAELYKRDWRKIDRFWAGIETYPSLLYSRGEAGRLFHEAPNAAMNLYVEDLWRSTVRPALEKFRAEHAGERT